MILTIGNWYGGDLLQNLLINPLFVALVILWVLQLYSLRKRWMESKFICIVTILTLLVLTALSIPNTNRLLYGLVEWGSTEEYTCPKEAVVVLIGGHVKGKDPSMDKLDEEAELAVTRGVEIFDKCNAKWLIMSGRTKIGSSKRDCELRRDLAVRLGVPPKQILIEANSTNTREQSMCLKSTGWVGEVSKLAIVTSPWHFNRSLIEFKRNYPNAVAVASYPHSYSALFSTSFMSWIPQALTLEQSCRPIHEFVGIVWYKLLSCFEDMTGMNYGECKGELL